VHFLQLFVERNVAAHVYDDGQAEGGDRAAIVPLRGGGWQTRYVRDCKSETIDLVQDRAIVDNFTEVAEGAKNVLQRDVVGANLCGGDKKGQKVRCNCKKARVYAA
jgi:hypothetical protein